MTLVLIVGLLMTVVALSLAARRALFLYRAISHGQPAPDRIQGVVGRLGNTLKRQGVEVLGQKKLLKWSIPGAAHFFVFWAFLILGTVYLEAYAVLLSRDPEWNWFVFGNWAVLGFLQDFIAVMCFFGIITFWWIRIVNNPKNQGRKSRFFGSHLGPAYLTLFMIFNVLWTLFLFRGAVQARDMGTDNGYGKAAFVSYGLGKVLPDSTALIGIGLLLHIGVMLVFLIFVLNSKHLHIFVAPLNVMFGREPVALGAAKPMMNAGKPLTLDDLEELDEDAKLGVGAAEDFSWKGILDMATCTECGRCQDQCPAWNTEKPLSPKLMMMALRDHTLSKTPYLLADESKRESLLEGNEALAKEVERPLVGDTGDEWFYMPEDGSGVIDPDVLWSCVTCGACVQQCPVDIEHVDHIVDMRRYQVLVESNFPAELNGLFKGLENKGNPWNMSSTARLDWAKDLPFDVKVVGEDVESLDEVEWLFWVGCAGAYEDRAKKTTRAVAELLDMAGVTFAVLGNGETCTGDSARRAGNEFVFQSLAAENIATFKETKVKKVVSTCAHCFNTLKNEYSQLGIELEVVHHTQLLNRLVREKKLAPVASNGGGDKRSITYHDPCYIGRHNGVYSPPRELLNVIPDASFTEMPRNSERSFCCGAGGARMWMEETIGTRINETRTMEAVQTGADQIAVGCPFCRVMLSDGLTSAQSKGEAREEVEVLDVAQMLLASVKGESKPVAKQAASEAKAARAAAPPPPRSSARTPPRPSPRPATPPRPRRRSPRPRTSARLRRRRVAARCSTWATTPTTQTARATPAAPRRTRRRPGPNPRRRPRPRLPPVVARCSTSAATIRTSRRRPRPRRRPSRRRRQRLSPRPRLLSPLPRSPTRASAAGRSSTWATTRPSPRPRRPSLRRRPARTPRATPPPTRTSTAARTTPTPTSNPKRQPRQPPPPLRPAPPPPPAPRSPRAARSSTSRHPPRKRSPSLHPQPRPRPTRSRRPSRRTRPSPSRSRSRQGRRGRRGRLHHRRGRRPQPGRRRHRRRTRSASRGSRRPRFVRHRLHPRHRDPRGRLALRHRGTRRGRGHQACTRSRDLDRREAGDRAGGQGRARAGAGAGAGAGGQGRRGRRGRLHHRRGRGPQRGRRRHRRRTRGGPVDEKPTTADQADDKQADEEPAEAESSDDAPITSLRDIKAKYAEGGSADSDSEAGDEGDRTDESSDDSDDSEGSDDEAEDESADEEQEKPKPASSGEAHQPKTDAEIKEGGSLFDL